MKPRTCPQKWPGTDVVKSSNFPFNWRRPEDDGPLNKNMKPLSSKSKAAPKQPACKFTYSKAGAA